VPASYQFKLNKKLGENVLLTAAPPWTSEACSESNFAGEFYFRGLLALNNLYSAVSAEGFFESRFFAHVPGGSSVLSPAV
jgi:hypothetical protein